MNIQMINNNQLQSTLESHHKVLLKIEREKHERFSTKNQLSLYIALCKVVVGMMMVVVVGARNICTVFIFNVILVVCSLLFFTFTIEKTTTLEKNVHVKIMLMCIRTKRSRNFNGDLPG